MQNNLNDAVTNYVKGIREYLDSYEWHEVIAYWNMASKSGYTNIYDGDSNLIRPQYYRDDQGLERPKRDTPATMREALRLIVNEYEASKDTPYRWNEGTIKIHSNGGYESSFIWNELAQLEPQIKTVQLAFDSLYESILEQISFELFPEINWKQAIATVLIRNGKIDPQSSIQVEGHTESYPVNLDDFWQREIPRFQKITNTEPLNAYFPSWNTLVYQLRYEDNFNLDKDLEYQMREIS